MKKIKEDMLVGVHLGSGIVMGIVERLMYKDVWRVHITGYTLAYRGRGQQDIEAKRMIPIKQLTSEEARNLTPNEAHAKFKDEINGVILNLANEKSEKLKNELNEVTKLIEFANTPPGPAY